jgi:hypothetical protein
MRNAALNVLAAVLVLVAVPVPGNAQASPTPDQPACTLEGKDYICSKSGLQSALASAHTVATASQPANRASDAVLASLVTKYLGKTLWSPGAESPADLTIRLTPIEPAGVNMGNSSVALAMINIFAPLDGNPLGRLIWSETYTGSPDLPWPSVANAVSRQLRSRLGLK